MWKRIKKFYEELKTEFNKVTWPTKDQTSKQTGAVLIFVLVMAVFLGVVDLGLAEIIKLIVG